MNTKATSINHASGGQLMSDSTEGASLKLRERFWQYQPSSTLVKLVFGWWLFSVLLAAMQISDGFGLAWLAPITQIIAPWSSQLSLFLLAVILMMLVIDWLCLLSISQPKRYTLSRQYPNNTPILHQLDITAYLSFESTPSRLDGLADKLVQPFINNGVIKTITIDFYDDYPSHLALIEPQTSVLEIDGIYHDGAVSIMPIQVQMETYSHSNSHLSTTDLNNRLSTHSTNNLHDTVHPDNLNRVKITYPVIAIERGTGYFGAASLRVWSPFKLLRRQFKLMESQHGSQVTAGVDRGMSHNNANKYIRVLADFSGLMSNQLSAVFEHSIHMGGQSILKQGSGSDFLKLREYTPGDAMRQIDWKATSRQRRLMSKSYEDDNDQDVVFLLDCGEQMRHHDTNPQAQIADPQVSNLPPDAIQGDVSGLLSAKITQQLNLQTSYFDKVLNAVLLLSYVANKQGDSVGLMSFAGDDIYLKPKKGASLIRNMLNDTADLQPSMQTSDYITAAKNLLKRLSKRSLVIVITNTRAEASDELTQALKLLSARHQVVFANLTEQVVHDHLQGNIPPGEFDDALLYHALISYQQERANLHKTLSQMTGALCLQTTANKLPMKLTQAYLSLKKS